MKAILVVADVGSAHETRVPIRDGWLVLVMSLRGILSEDVTRPPALQDAEMKNQRNLNPRRTVGGAYKY